MSVEMTPEQRIMAAAIIMRDAIEEMDAASRAGGVTPNQPTEGEPSSRTTGRKLRRSADVDAHLRENDG